MRHIIRSRPTLTHIFPRTMKAMPPNIFFSSTSPPPPRATLTRCSKTSSGGIAFSLGGVLGMSRQAGWRAKWFCCIGFQQTSVAARNSGAVKHESRLSCPPRHPSLCPCGLSRLCPPRRRRFQLDKMERFADQCAYLVVIELGKLDTDPAAYTNVGRSEINSGRLLDQS